MPLLHACASVARKLELLIAFHPSKNEMIQHAQKATYRLHLTY